jgi:hypothetical protein
VDVHEGTWEGFWSMITGGDHQQRNTIRTPSFKYVTLMCKWIFGENERDKDNQHGVELALLGFDCLVANRPSYLMINRWCCEATSGSEDIGSGCYLSILAIYLFKTRYYKEPE